MLRDWNSYARCYDLLCQINPAYHVLLRDFSKFLQTLAIDEPLQILDIGAGTGNFLLEAARALDHNVKLTHLDADQVMNELAREILDADGTDEKKRAAAKFYLEREVEASRTTPAAAARRLLEAFSKGS